MGKPVRCKFLGHSWVSDHKGRFCDVCGMRWEAWRDDVREHGGDMG